MKKLCKIIAVPVEKEIRCGDLLRCSNPDRTNLDGRFVVADQSDEKWSENVIKGGWVPQQLVVLSDKDCRFGFTEKAIAIYPKKNGKIPSLHLEFVIEWTHNPVSEIEVEYFSNSETGSNIKEWVEPKVHSKENFIFCNIPEQIDNSTYPEFELVKIIGGACLKHHDSGEGSYNKEARVVLMELEKAGYKIIKS